MPKIQKGSLKLGVWKYILQPLSQNRDWWSSCPPLRCRYWCSSYWWQLRHPRGWHCSLSSQFYSWEVHSWHIIWSTCHLHLSQVLGGHVDLQSVAIVSPDKGVGGLELSQDAFLGAGIKPPTWNAVFDGKVGTQAFMARTEWNLCHLVPTTDTSSPQDPLQLLPISGLQWDQGVLLLVHNRPGTKDAKTGQDQALAPSSHLGVVRPQA